MKSLFGKIVELKNFPAFRRYERLLIISQLWSGASPNYWSSSQNSATNAWIVYFNNSYTAGRLNNNGKTNTNRVRCVR